MNNNNYPVLVRDAELTEDQQISIEDLNVFATLSESECEVRSHRGNVDVNTIFTEYEDIRDLVTFTTLYTYNILNNSSVAKRKKSTSVYDYDIQTEVDFKDQKVNINVYVDDDVFGLVVGRGFKTSQNFITAIHPIMAKMSDYFHRIKFFPYSSLNQ